MKKLSFCIFCLLFSLNNAAQSDSSVNSKESNNISKNLSVVVSIKPIHSLVSAIMQGVSKPVLLLKGHESPHSFRFKPSSAKAVQQADVVIYVSDHLETFLVKPLKSMVNGGQIVEIADLKGLNILEFREDKLGHKEHNNHNSHVEYDAHEEHGAHEEHQNHGHDEIDPHLWLDPNNAIIMAKALMSLLSEKDSAHAMQYKKNTLALISEIKQLDVDLLQKMAGLQTQQYLVFHDSYQYFEKHYQLNSSGSIILQSIQNSSAYRLNKIKQILQEKQVVCVFTEPQFSPKKVEVLLSGTAIKTDILDPLGATIDQGPKMYLKMMRQMAHSFQKCLQKSQ